jgi:hypothetical protein
MCGETINVKRLSMDRIYVCVEDGLREKHSNLDGIALQDAAEKCVEAGKFPVNAIVKLIAEACSMASGEPLDVEDAQALCTPDRLEACGQVLAEIALGEDPGKDAEKNGDAPADAGP